MSNHPYKINQLVSSDNNLYTSIRIPIPYLVVIYFNPRPSSNRFYKTYINYFVNLFFQSVISMNVVCYIGYIYIYKFPKRNIFLKKIPNYLLVFFYSVKIR